MPTAFLLALRQLCLARPGTHRGLLRPVRRGVGPLGTIPARVDCIRITGGLYLCSSTRHESSTKKSPVLKVGHYPISASPWATPTKRLAKILFCMQLATASTLSPFLDSTRRFVRLPHTTTHDVKYFQILARRLAVHQVSLRLNVPHEDCYDLAIVKHVHKARLLHFAKNLDCRAL